MSNSYDQPWTPPEVKSGRVLGFVRTSKGGGKYISAFYKDAEGNLHQLSIIKNEAKNGSIYYGGYGEAFEGQLEAEDG